MSCIAAANMKTGFEKVKEKKTRHSHQKLCRVFLEVLLYKPMMPCSANQITGMSSAGSMLSVLQSLSPRMPMPELAIKIPPMIEISVKSSAERNGARKPAPR